MLKSRKRRMNKNSVSTFQPDEKEINRLEWGVRIIQTLVPIIWAFRSSIFWPESFLWWESVIFFAGFALAVISQLRIFIPTRFGARRLLFTGDVFKYTRHPMYTGMAIADLTLWRYNIGSMVFVSSAVVMYGIMFVAAWMQEKEMLAKFGPAAKTYYAKTPRFFFLYPFIRK